jgi:hypothetical protein
MTRRSSIATAFRMADRGYRAALVAPVVHEAAAMAAGAKPNGTAWKASDPWVVSLM